MPFTLGAKCMSAVGIGAILGVTLALCQPDQKDMEKTYLEGIVTKESGSVTGLVPSDASLFNNETVKIGDKTYVLTVDTKEGTYYINVRDSYNKPIKALAEAIEPGDSVKFWTGKYRNETSGELFDFDSKFSNDRIGSLYSSEIELTKKQNQGGE